jgi:hypothetical protein
MPSAAKETKGVKGDFGWMFQLLTALTSTLAIVALARNAFIAWSLSAPLSLVMDAYNVTMQALFGWAQPYLQAALTWLGSFIGWRPTLYPHWRDVFVLTGLLGTGWTRAYWQSGDIFLDNKIKALRTASVMGPIALMTALVAGVLPLSSNNLGIQLLIAASFGVAVFVVWLLLQVARLDWDNAILLLLVFFTSIALVVTLLLSLAFRRVAGIGVAGIAVHVVCMAIMVPAFKFEDEPVALTFRHTILCGFIGAFCFFVIDAGLKLVTG